MDTILLCGGHMDDPFVRDCIEDISPDCIIGIDRGLEFCYRNRIVPKYILGDFDSISPEVIAWYREQTEIPIREYKPEKDATDTRMGLELALKLGSDRIFLLGATGGRLDHYMGNLQSLVVPAMAGKEAWILDEQNAMTVLSRSRTIKKECAFGKYISFFSMGDEVRGITLSGFKYPLKDYDMTNFDGIGVSNELAEDTALVEFRQGFLLMVMSKDK
ncbi:MULTISPECIES: thiamine diphosphokinase [Blautia]|uniref:thiamine diphosphokinase n=1 Tax=Blautia TaxID=572511 RepID=UPI000BA305F7|nr:MULTISPECIES: thiamine diphosphokinase [Blautia]